MTVAALAYGPRMSSWHPWRALRHRQVEVEFRNLPDGILGTTTGNTITITTDLLQTERRCTATHEAIHHERQDGACASSWHELKQERTVDEEAARRLITLTALADALCWAHDEWEVADECWVDAQTVRTRLDTLTRWEQDYIERRIAANEGAA